MNEPSPIIAARGLRKSFREGSGELEIFSGIDLTVGRGERLAIVGASGAGKSTLLHILGGLDTASSGEVVVDGEAMSALSDAARGRLRNRALGFVYQFHHLLPEFTALENVAMPLLIRRLPVAEARSRASEMLDRVGLGQRLDKGMRVCTAGHGSLCHGLTLPQGRGEILDHTGS